MAATFCPHGGIGFQLLCFVGLVCVCVNWVSTFTNKMCFLCLVVGWMGSNQKVGQGPSRKSTSDRRMLNWNRCWLRTCLTGFTSQQCWSGWRKETACHLMTQTVLKKILFVAGAASLNLYAITGEDGRNPWLSPQPSIHHFWPPIKDELKVSFSITFNIFVIMGDWLSTKMCSSCCQVTLLFTTKP